jgi:hypothetical protein
MPQDIAAVVDDRDIDVAAGREDRFARTSVTTASGLKLSADRFLSAESGQLLASLSSDVGGLRIGGGRDENSEYSGNDCGKTDHFELSMSKRFGSADPSAIRSDRSGADTPLIAAGVPVCRPDMFRERNYFITN